MILLYQTHSPFARKALVFAHEAGLADRIEVVHHETSPTLRNAAVYAENPLGKVPVLLRPDADPLFDSSVICAYLDTLHDGPRLIPTKGEARWRALRMEALAHDMAQAGIAVRWETVRRPETMRYPPLAEGQSDKLLASYDWLETAFTQPMPAMDVGQIALATTLTWLEFRDLPSFRTGHPRLCAWLDAFDTRASMKVTDYSGETHD